MHIVPNVKHKRKSREKKKLPQSSKGDGGGDLILCPQWANIVASYTLSGIGGELVDG